jgi:hypothetical protein
MSVSPHIQTSGKTKLKINPAGRLSQWLTHGELKLGIQRDGESAQLFVNNQQELELLANTFRSNPTLMELSKVESMSGGAALGCAHHMAQGRGRGSRGDQESGGRCLASIVQRAEASNSDNVLQNQDGAHRARRAMGARESRKMLTALEHPKLCVSQVST